MPRRSPDRQRDVCFLEDSDNLARGGGVIGTKLLVCPVFFPADHDRIFLLEFGPDLGQCLFHGLLLGGLRKICERLIFEF